MLTDKEIEFVTNKWIGVDSGYLGDFTYRTHREFYYDYCGIENINPDIYEGTTRARFEHILKISNPKDQAKILRGILERFPQEAASSRTNVFKSKLDAYIDKCENDSFIRNEILNINNDTIEQALEDSNLFIENDRPVSAVDRLHTAFHGYLIEICNNKGIEITPNSSITKIFKAIRSDCTEFSNYENHSDDVKKILNSLSAIINSINNIRNNGSFAHPNEKLLSKETAGLYINTVRTILNFIKSKIDENDR